MSEINVRADAVDIEQIMRQIRARIRDKRGADYTEAELQQLASVKLEKFLDPRGVRSDLVEQFRKYRVVSPEPPTYEFEDSTLYDTHRGLLRTIRRLLNPILKLFINPNPVVHALHIQKQVNTEYHRRFRQREEMDPLFFEVIHNLVVELTRAGIEVQNLKMRVESLSSRMDFDERRGRALEGVVQNRRPATPGSPSRGPGGQQGGGRQAAAPAAPPATQPSAAPASAPATGTDETGPTAAITTVTDIGAAPVTAPGAPTEGRADGEKRRRRRRRRRRPGQTLADQQAQGAGATSDAQAGGDEGGDAGDDFEGPDEGGPDDGAPSQ